MSAESAEAFIARVQEDPELGERLLALREDPTAVQALIAAEGFDASPDEIREAFLEAFGSQLSEEELAAIAGGQLRNEGAVIGVGVVVGAGVVGAAAVAGV